MIPGPSGELAKGEQRLNWLWYWNVPEGDELRKSLTDEEGVVHEPSVPQGKLREDLARGQGSATEEVLPEAFQWLFATTEEPFIQTIYDLSVSRMALGRACPIGEAAFLPRPNTAASTSKAVTHATELAKSIGSHHDDVPTALKEWDPERLELGNDLKAHGKVLGDKSQSVGELLGSLHYG